MSEFLKLLPSLLVVGGWVIVYQLQALQARRKLLREEAEKTRTAVEKLNEAALRFHMNERSESDRLVITAALTDLERRCELFPKIAASRKKWLPSCVDPQKVKVDVALIVAARKAITLEHFDDPDAEALKLGSPQLEAITSSCTTLIRTIDEVLVASLD